MHITALYAGLLAPLFVLLSMRVIALRRRDRVALGDGGSAGLARRIRVQANFVEYVPLALLLIALAEAMTAPAALLHLMGLALLFGRMSHAWGVSQDLEVLGFRAAGMLATFSVLLIASATCLVLAVGGRH